MPNPDTIYYCATCQTVATQDKPCPKCGEAMTEYTRLSAIKLLERTGIMSAEEVRVLMASDIRTSPAPDFPDFDAIKYSYGANIKDQLAPPAMTVKEAGRKGGSSTSPRKQEAVRANGRKHTAKKG